MKLDFLDSYNAAAGDSVAIPEGYHDGTGEVSAQPLSNQTPGTATAEDIIWLE